MAETRPTPEEQNADRMSDDISGGVAPMSPEEYAAYQAAAPEED